MSVTTRRLFLQTATILAAVAPLAARRRSGRIAANRCLRRDL